MLSIFLVSHGAVTVEMHLRIAEQAIVDQFEAILQHWLNIGPLFENGKSALHKPAAAGSRSEWIARRHHRRVLLDHRFDQRLFRHHRIDHVLHLAGGFGREGRRAMLRAQSIPGRGGVAFRVVQRLQRLPRPIELSDPSTRRWCGSTDRSRLIIHAPWRSHSPELRRALFRKRRRRVVIIPSGVAVVGTGGRRNRGNQQRLPVGRPCGGSCFSRRQHHGQRGVCSAAAPAARPARPARSARTTGLRQAAMARTVAR